MWEQYKETFDGVHASQRLKTEVLNMKREENVTKRRRVPVMALVAAALVVALAGTALAVEWINHFKVELINPDNAGVSTEGYFLEADFPPIPLESLSEQALERFASGDADQIDRVEGIDIDYASWYFDSWAEAEDFLGLDLGRNTLLEQYPEIALGGSDHWRCLSGGAVIESEGTKVPVVVDFMSEYRIEDCLVTVTANLEVDAPGAEQFLGRPLGQWEALRRVGTEDGRDTTENEQYTAEEYTTPNGLTAFIVTRSGTQVLPDWNYDLQSTWAFFVRNNASYMIHCKGPSHEVESALLKMILDAYE